MTDELLKLVEKRARAYGLKELAQDSGLTRQTLYTFLRGGNLTLNHLYKILKVLGLRLEVHEEVRDEDVLGSLSRLGAPLPGMEDFKRMGLEETLARALEVSRRESRLSTVLPYVLIKRAYQIKAGELIDLLKQPQEFQLLGYYTELALKYRYRAPLETLLSQLWAAKNQFKPLALRERDQGRAAADFARFVNPSAEKWKVLTRDREEDVVARLMKWEQLNEAS